MKLDRNINPNGRGKYALLKLRRVDEFTAGLTRARIDDAFAILEMYGILDWGDRPETEFFPIRLKDKYASHALEAYAISAFHDGEQEYAAEIEQLAARAGPNSPFCKKPD
jgi:hypothetical protein